MAGGGTEHVGQRFRELDRWTTGDVLEALWAGQSRAVAAGLAALPAIGKAIDAAAGRLGETGRLIYVGAGSSAVLGALDGLELTPTFNWPANRVVVVLAGIADLHDGFDGAVEDDGGAGIAKIEAANCGPADVVIGISASGNSAFTVGALATARARGALTLGIAGNPGSPLLATAEHPIAIQTGEEVIAGSTRLAAGTAQKCVLNLFSTGLMVRLGYVYGNLMINVRVENAKLQRRALDMLRGITGCNEATAATTLAACAGDLKQAVLVLNGMSPEAAKAALAAAGGNLRRAMG
jgi:N-acetylmuramic acid 6-phosphate etherase